MVPGADMTDRPEPTDVHRLFNCPNPVTDPSYPECAVYCACCGGCEHLPCLQTEDCPGGRHYERQVARDGEPIW